MLLAASLRYLPPSYRKSVKGDAPFLVTADNRWLKVGRSSLGYNLPGNVLAIGSPSGGFAHALTVPTIAGFQGTILAFTEDPDLSATATLLREGLLKIRVRQAHAFDFASRAFVSGFSDTIVVADDAAAQMYRGVEVASQHLTEHVPLQVSGQTSAQRLLILDTQQTPPQNVLDRLGWLGCYTRVLFCVREPQITDEWFDRAFANFHTLLFSRPNCEDTARLVERIGFGLSVAEILRRPESAVFLALQNGQRYIIENPAPWFERREFAKVRSAFK